mgnify:CR=1 FL=1
MLATMPATINEPERIRYGVVMASPPWRLPDPTEMDYKPLTTLQIRTLPVSRLAALDSVLFLACPPICLPHALEVLGTWGFSFVTVMTQVKPAKPYPAAKDKAWAEGWWDKGAMTSIVVGERGIVRPPPEVLHGLTSYVGGKGDALEPYRMLAEAVWPGPYLEVWAKSVRPGWDVWGKGIKSSIFPLAGLQLNHLEDERVKQGMERIHELWQNHLSGAWEIGDIIQALYTSTRRRLTRYQLWQLAGAQMTGLADFQTAMNLHHMSRMFPPEERHRPWKECRKLYDVIRRENAERNREVKRKNQDVEAWVNETFGFVDVRSEPETTDQPDLSHQEPGPRPAP